MRAAALALLAATTLAIPALAASDEEPYETFINSGRVGFMMHEARTVLPTIATHDLPSPPYRPGMRVQIFDNLVGAVHEYNAASYFACHHGILSGDLCIGPFLPKWLTAEAASFTDDQLRAMTDETMDRLQPFWSAICAKAPEPAGGEPVCPME